MTRHADVYRHVYGSLPDRAAPFEGHSPRTIVMTGFVILLLLLGLIALIRRVVRGQGGWRGTGRRIRREVRLTARAFAEPFRRRGRYRRGVRALTAALADPATRVDGAAAIEAADVLVAAAPGAGAYAVAIDPRDACVHVAGRRLRTPPQPWTVDAGHARRRRIARDRIPEPDAAHEPATLVAIGCVGRDTVFVDPFRGPGLLCVSGTTRGAKALVQAVAAQTALVSDVRTVVTEGVHPAFRGPRLADVLDALDTHGPAPLVVCAITDPRGDDAAAVARHAASGTAAFVVLGEVDAHRHALRVDPDGHARSADLALDVYAAPLTAAVRARLRRGAATPPPPPIRALPPEPASSTRATAPAPNADLAEPGAAVRALPAGTARPEAVSEPTRPPAVPEPARPDVLSEPASPVRESPATAPPTAVEKADPTPVVAVPAPTETVARAATSQGLEEPAATPRGAAGAGFSSASPVRTD